MAKGDAAHAAEHQHGVQVKLTGTADKTIVERLDALEARVEQLARSIAQPVVEAVEAADAVADLSEKPSADA